MKLLREESVFNMHCNHLVFENTTLSNYFHAMTFIIQFDVII